MSRLPRPLESFISEMRSRLDRLERDLRILKREQATKTNSTTKSETIAFAKHDREVMPAEQVKDTSYANELGHSRI